MLVMTRKKGEQIVIDDSIVIKVVEIRGDKVGGRRRNSRPIRFYRRRGRVNDKGSGV